MSHTKSTFSFLFLFFVALCVCNVLAQSIKPRLKARNFCESATERLQTLSVQLENLAFRVDRTGTELDSKMAFTSERLSYLMTKFELSLNRIERLQNETDTYVRKIENLLNFWYTVAKNMSEFVSYGSGKAKQSPEDTRKIVSEELDVLKEVLKKGLKTQMDTLLTVVMNIQENLPTYVALRNSPNSGSSSCSEEKVSNIIKYQFAAMRKELRDEVQEIVTSADIGQATLKSPTERSSKSLDGIVFEAEKPNCPDLDPNKSENVGCSKDHNLIAAKDCAEIFKANGTCSDTYPAWIKGSHTRIYCDMRDGGGWTVILRRGKFSNKNYDFQHDWKAYRQGFGDAKNELWLGTEKIHRFTESEPHVLRVQLVSFSGRCTTLYFSDFKVLSEAEDYRLIVGQPINSSLEHAKLFLEYNNTDFVTGERMGEDRFRNCGFHHLKTGWWMSPVICDAIHLTGAYLEEQDRFLRNKNQGIRWLSFDKDRSLKQVQMSIRPSSLKP